MPTPLTLVVLAIGLCAISVLVWMTERHRRKTKLLRFTGREFIDVEDLIRSSFPTNANISYSLVFWWNRAAAVLRIDPRLIRKGDRFDGILAPVKGCFSRDEIMELDDLIEEVLPKFSKQLQATPLNTFGECVLYFAQHADIDSTED